MAPGAHGGTFGGNVVACAAANATLDVIEDEALVENARDRGAQLLGRAAPPGCPRTRRSGDVRGLGLHGRPWSSSSRTQGDRGRRTRSSTKRVIAEALERHLIVLSAGPWGQVVRLIPPLVTTAEEVDLALHIFDEALRAAGS